LSPFFSIIIPCYNQGHYLKDAVDSVLEQNYYNLEIIIVNDGSTDETEIIAKKLLNSDRRIQVITQENKGLSAARNVGIKHAKGIYLHFLDADDWVLNGCYELVETEIKANDHVIIGVGYSYRRSRNLPPMHGVFPSRDKSVYPEILSGNIGPCHSFFIPKNKVKEVGGFDEKLRSGEDWDLWIRLVKSKIPFLFIEKELVVYRFVQNSMSRNGIVMYQELKKVYLRGNTFDDRLSSELSRNIRSQLVLGYHLKPILIQCLGVLVVQGKVREAFELLKSEKEEFEMKFISSDFKSMNSYLTFRYWNELQDLNELIKNSKVFFLGFFNMIFSDKNEVASAMNQVFSQVFWKMNRMKYGRFLGAILNKLF
jgi:glycosyltransferase involved in cell wall biosynthesis